MDDQRNDQAKATDFVGFCDLCTAPVREVHRYTYSTGEDPNDPTIKHVSCEERDLDAWWEGMKKAAAEGDPAAIMVVGADADA
jgi:hypothetical protein